MTVIKQFAALALLVLLMGAFSAPGLAEGAMAAEVVGDAQVDTIEDDDAPLSAGLDTTGDGEIDIYKDIESPKNGDIVTLSTPLSKVSNDAGLLVQWYVDRGDGKGFAPIAGASEKTYSYIQSDACERFRYRVELFVPGPDHDKDNDDE